MKPEELRIGNYFRYGKSFVYDAGSISTIIVLDLEDVSGYEPIPITEEWLLDFGFQENPYQDRYELGDIDVECDKTRGFTDLWLSGLPHIKYIHQLQNLVYILTGEELIRK